MNLLCVSQPHSIHKYLNGGENNRTIGSLLFPTKLNQFSKKIFPTDLKDDFVNRILIENTALNYYKPFVTNQKYKALMQYILDYKAPFILSSLTSENDDGLKYVKICPVCQREDNDTGALHSFLSITHQLPYVFFCYQCDSPLYQSSVPNKFYGQKLMLADKLRNDCVPIFHSALPAHQEEFFIQFSRLSHWLRKNGSRLGSLEITCSKLWLWHAKNNQSPSVDTNPNLSKINIANHFSAFFKNLEIQNLKAQKPTKLLKLFDSHRKFSTPSISPFKIALYCDYLSIDPISFFETNIVSSLIGDGPHPCLNPICEYFNIPKISHAKFHTRVDRCFFPFITVSCDCGFEYGYTQKSGRSESSSVAYEFISSYGELWNQTLSSLWAGNSRSLSELSNIFRAPKALLVYHAYLLGLEPIGAFKSNDLQWFTTSYKVIFSPIERYKKIDAFQLDNQLSAEIDLAVNIFKVCGYTYSHFSKNKIFDFIDDCTEGRFHTSRISIVSNKNIDLPKTNEKFSRMQIEFISTWSEHFSAFANRLNNKNKEFKSTEKSLESREKEKEFKRLRYLTSIQTGNTTNQTIESLDAVILKLVQINLQETLSKRPFRQITFHSLAGFMDFQTVESNYPKSMSFIGNVIESDIEFWDRKIRETMKYFQNNDQAPTFTEFAKLSGRPVKSSSLKDHVDSNIKKCVNDLRNIVIEGEDALFLNRLLRVVQAIKDHYPYIRVSYPELCRRLGIEIQRFRNSLKNYPKSREFLKDELESETDFMLRKFKSSTKLFFIFGICPSLTHYDKRCKFSSRKTAAWIKPMVIRMIASWPPESIESIESIESSITPVRSSTSE